MSQPDIQYALPEHRIAILRANTAYGSRTRKAPSAFSDDFGVLLGLGTIITTMLIVMAVL